MYEYKEAKKNKSLILNELKAKGIVVISNFFSSQNCNKSILEIQEGLNLYKNKSRTISKEGLSGDQRLFKFEKFSKGAMKFKNDEFINSIAYDYLDGDCVNEFVLAGKVSKIDGKISNSGGDWHRDSDKKQFKSILYLNDVTSLNGPFSFFLNSKEFDFPRRKIKSNILFKILYLLKLKKRPPRYKNDIIKKKLDLENESNLVTIKGNRGTLILCDTSYIHRGEPIKEGVRYSFTNYFFDNSEKVRIQVEKKFKKLYI